MALRGIKSANKGGTFLDEGALRATGRQREGEGRPEYVVTRPIVFEIGAKGSGMCVWVPASYITDGYSLPGRFLQWWQPEHANWLLPAILHDWLYDTGRVPRDMCDRILLQAMREVGVAAWQRFIVYRAVRLGGGGGYGRPTPDNLSIVNASRDAAVADAVLAYLKETTNDPE